MFTHKFATAAVVGALTLGLAAAPAMAAPGGQGNGKGKGKPATAGQTTVQFTKGVKTKLGKDGIRVVAVSPAKKQNSVTFRMPAQQATGSSIITHTGALGFARADRGVQMNSIVFDMSAGVVNYTDDNGNVVEDVFDLGNVKTTKKTIKARWVVAAGQAAVLNEQLSTTVFTDGMFVAKTNTKFTKKA